MSSPKAPDKPDPQKRRLDRERRARKRAEELLETRSRELYQSKLALEEAYSATVEVFASLVGGKSGRSSGELRTLARRARRLATRTGLGKERAQTVYLAGLLCDLGKLALPDEIAAKPLVTLSHRECEQFRLHPRFAYEALTALPPLEAVAKTILGHCELFNGKGYPDRLTWDQISEESRVLCVVKDFDALLRGLLVTDALTQTEAIEYLRSHRDVAYGGDLVDAFTQMIEEREDASADLAELRLAPRSLQPGMTLTRDLTNERGVLILPAEQCLDKALIEKLRVMAQTRTDNLLLYVAAPTGEPDDDSPDDDQTQAGEPEAAAPSAAG